MIRKHRDSHWVALLMKTMRKSWCYKFAWGSYEQAQSVHETQLLGFQKSNKKANFFTNTTNVDSTENVYESISEVLVKSQNSHGTNQPRHFSPNLVVLLFHAVNFVAWHARRVLASGHRSLTSRFPAQEKDKKQESWVDIGTLQLAQDINITKKSVSPQRDCGRGFINVSICMKDCKFGASTVPFLASYLPLCHLTYCFLRVSFILLQWAGCDTKQTSYVVWQLEC